MAKELTDIQISVRTISGDGNLDIITDASNLAAINRIYRDLAIILPWPELRRKDTSLSTTANTKEYDFIESPIFQVISSIEVQDDHDNDYYRIVTPPKDELSWNRAENQQAKAVPDHYVRYSTNEKQKIEFRPATKYASKTIRITGIIEPDDLEATESTTFFAQRIGDDAFENLIAAYFSDKDGLSDVAGRLKNNAVTKLRQIFGKENVPTDLLK